MEDLYVKQRLEFDEFFMQFRLEKDEKDKIQTHTCFGKPYGKYHIPDDKYDKFLNLYKKIVCKTEDLHIIERHDGKQVGPFIIDIDYWVDGKNSERQYKQEHIEKLIKITTNIIKKYFKVDNNDLIALVMEKKKPSYNSSKNSYKDGFHILYPVGIYIKHRYFIINKVKEEAKVLKIFDNIPFTNKNGYDEIFDSSVVCSNGLTMYGSRKEDGQIYYLTMVYNHLNEQQKLNYEPDEIVSLCSIRKFNDDDNLEILNDDAAAQINEYINTKFNYKKKNNKLEVNINTEQLNRKKGKEEDINLARKLLKILDIKRAEIYSDWINVGWALFNIDYGLLNDYITFSKQSSKWKPGCCEKVWENAKLDGLTIASLRWWAQQDNPEEYWKIMRESINKLILEAESGNHDDISKIVFELYKHKYRCTSISKNSWYEFQDHRWVSLDSGYTLNNRLSDEITKVYLYLANYFYSQAIISEGFENETFTNRARKMSNMIEKLKNVSFKNQVMAASANRFHDISGNFEELLDSNPNLLGFENGVYDLEQGVFRAGLPDDYILMSTKYNYKSYSPDDPEIKLIENYFSKVMIEENMRKYVLKFISSCLDGFSREQKFVLWTGVGCHAPNTKILMYNGTIKNVQDVKCNDKLMGDDNEQRIVKQLFNGEQDMYKVFLDNNDTFIVNRNHRLALKNKLKYNIYRDLDAFNKLTLWVEWYEYIDNVPINKKATFENENDAIYYFENEIVKKENFIHYNQVIPVFIYDYLYLDDKVKNDYVMYSKYIEFNNNSNNVLYSKLDNRLQFIADIVNNCGEVESQRYKLPIYIFNNFEVETIFRSVGIKVKIIDNYIYLYDGIINLLSEKVKNPEKRINLINNYNNECEYKIIKIDNLGLGKFYGFEIDGNERYLMGNFMATYNSNGKSTTVELMEKTLGDYFGILPTTVLTRKRGSSSNATPELANKRGKRVLIIQEPEHDDTVYVGLMKNLTGGDWIEARALYGMPFRYKPQFKLILVCNKLPHIPANDMGTWRRLRVSPWESKFIDDEPKLKNEFKKDKKLQEQLTKWKQAFVWLLLNKYYPDYKNNGLEEPAKVTQFTDNYKQAQDIFSGYFGECIIFTDNPKDKMSLQTIYENLKTYIKDSGNYNGQIPSRKELDEYIISMDKYNYKNRILYGAKDSEINIHDI